PVTRYALEGAFRYSIQVPLFKPPHLHAQRASEILYVVRLIGKHHPHLIVSNNMCAELPIARGNPIKARAGAVSGARPTDTDLDPGRVSRRQGRWIPGERCHQVSRRSAMWCCIAFVMEPDRSWRELRVIREADWSRTAAMAQRIPNQIN